MIHTCIFFSFFFFLLLCAVDPACDQLRGIDINKFPETDAGVQS